MNKELAVVISNDNKECTIEECIDAVKKAGFKKVFTQWYDKEFIPDQKKQVELCQKAGLEVIFVHLGYQTMNHLWMEDEIGESLVERYSQNIRDVAALGVPMVIMHLSAKFENPSPNEIGLERIRKIVKVAEECKVKIAFENTKTLSQLYYVLNNIDSPYVGLCFDAGHWHCNNKENWNPRDFKGRVFAIHLHDNDGKEDQHLLPFDGTMDWCKVIKVLNECEYDGPVTMELCYRKGYLAITPEEFYRKGYHRGLAITELMD